MNTTFTRTSTATIADAAAAIPRHDKASIATRWLPGPGAALRCC
jgi:hypothetical protein